MGVRDKSAPLGSFVLPRWAVPHVRMHGRALFIWIGSLEMPLRSMAAWSRDPQKKYVVVSIQLDRRATSFFKHVKSGNNINGVYKLQRGASEIHNYKSVLGIG
jgi:hypothetical protein